MVKTPLSFRCEPPPHPHLRSGWLQSHPSHLEQQQGKRVQLGEAGITVGGAHGPAGTQGVFGQCRPCTLSLQAPLPPPQPQVSRPPAPPAEDSSMLLPGRMNLLRPAFRHCGPTCCPEMCTLDPPGWSHPGTPDAAFAFWTSQVSRGTGPRRHTAGPSRGPSEAPVTGYAVRRERPFLVQVGMWD